jgi:hypothetical protein
MQQRNANRLERFRPVAAEEVFCETVARRDALVEDFQARDVRELTDTFEELPRYLGERGRHFFETALKDSTLQPPCDAEADAMSG